MVMIITKYPVCSREKDGMGAGWYRVVNESMGSEFENDFSQCEATIQERSYT